VLKGKERCRNFNFLKEELSVAKEKIFFIRKKTFSYFKGRSSDVVAIKKPLPPFFFTNNAFGIVSKVFFFMESSQAEKCV
jgi:hypothetical protein